MRTKAFLTSILLGSSLLAGVASADPMYRPSSGPVVRDHRNDGDDVRFNNNRFGDRRVNVRRWQRPIRVDHRPSWLQVGTPMYGFQVDNDGDEVAPYAYGQDPYVEGVARGEWSLLGRGLKLGLGSDTRAVIDLGGQPLRSIELQATSGRSVIDQVHVELTDGREIKLAPSRDLDTASAPNLRLDLGAQAEVGVSRIEIFGRSGYAGTFRVVGG